MSRKKFNFKNGDCYEGETSDTSSPQDNTLPMMAGEGLYTFCNGSYYSGQFLNNKFHGQGIFYDERSKSKIIGTFRNNAPHSNCTIEYSDGSIYEGAVQGFKRHGKGLLKMRKEDPVVQYEGDFVDDVVRSF